MPDPDDLRIRRCPRSPDGLLGRAPPYPPLELLFTGNGDTKKQRKIII